MKIKSITIKNFRSIKSLENFEIKDFNIFVGENGTGKTSLLEAIHYCLSPYFISGKIKHTDFFNGGDDPIEIILNSENDFTISLPDGYTKQTVLCNKIFLKIKKRDRAAPNKAFSDIVSVEHYFVPVESKNESGWSINRKGGSSKFTFDERLLSLSIAECEELSKSFYFQKNRDKQLQKGFNSSISSVFDDFNWRFNKEIRKSSEENEKGDINSFLNQKNNIESEIINKIDDKSQKKTFEELNKKLKEVGLENINISFIDSQAPFDSAFLGQKKNELDLPINQLGSGIEMMMSLLFLETLAELSKSNFLILIDEPELHLHPDIQEKLVKHLVETSKNHQIIISTHSPLFVKQSIQTKEDSNIKILKKGVDNMETVRPESSVLDYVSANEINFVAFGLPTEEYHNELYNELESRFKAIEGNEKKKQKEFDNTFFKEKGALLDSPFFNVSNQVTKHTYIRNKIHHSKDNGGLPTSEELRESINFMKKLF